MRKVVKVDEMINIASFEMKRANKYLCEGKYELYEDLVKRAEGMISLIAITAIKDNEDWNTEWNKIYDIVNK